MNYQFGWVDLFGALGFLIGSGAFLLKKKHKLLMTASFGSAMWSIHWILLGAYTSAALNIAVAVRSQAAARVKSDKARHLLFFIATSFFIGMTIFSWQGWISLMPFLAVTTSTFSYAYLDNIRMRWLVYFCSVLWIINSVYWGSWYGIGSEAVRIVLNSIGLYSVYKDQKNV